MARQDNWAYSLGAYISSIHHTPFSYGVHDCGILAAGCIKAVTGVDAMPPMSYTDPLEAAHECKAVCGSPYMDDLIAHLAEQHGWEKVTAPFAHRGDLVVIGTGIKARLGVVSMQGTHIMTPGDDGLVYEPFDRFNPDLTIYHL